LHSAFFLPRSRIPQSLPWRPKRKRRDTKGEQEQEASFANAPSVAGPKRRRTIAPQPHSETLTGTATTTMVGSPSFWIPLRG